MPEGDTIYRAAAKVRPVLEGRRLTGFWSSTLRGDRPAPGRLVTGVRTAGKHLLVDFERDLSIDVHLGMTGRWWVDDGSRRPRQGPGLRLWLATEAGTAACYSAPTIRSFHPSRDDPTAHLGPDLTADDEPDLDAVLRRARAVDDTLPVHEVLMDQRVASGIGNVFKSEVLFRRRISPFTPIGELDDERLRGLYVDARDQLRRNALAGSGRRNTTPHGGQFVYGRRGQGCRRCGRPVRRHGGEGGGGTGAPEDRSTYWCPHCQPGPDPGRPRSDARSGPDRRWPRP